MLLHDPRQFPPAFHGTVLCIGNFDGVHLGHAQMLSTARRLATLQKRPFTIMTFDPHPAVILRPQALRPALTVPAQRASLLQDFKPDALLIIPTTADFLRMPAEDFVAGIIDAALHASLIVEGPTFTFGMGAGGNPETLRQLAPAHGFTVEIVPSHETTLTDLTQVPVSSSLIRWLLEHGRVADAAKCLGRPYTLRGGVVHGEKRGRAIGYPTANLSTTQLLPAVGIYAGRATTSQGQYRAAISIGTNPTFGRNLPTVEAYLLDFAADLYEQTIDLQFHRWVRDTLTFSGVEPLIRQIAHDVQMTRETIALES